MPIPHILRRSGRKPYREPANQQVIARTISAQLGPMIDRADRGDFETMAYLLEYARIEADRLAAGLA